MNTIFRFFVFAAMLVSAIRFTFADETPRATFRSLVEEYEEVGNAREVAPKFIALAESHPKDPIAIDALIWVVTNLRRGDDLAQAIQMIAKNHIESRKLTPVCELLVKRPSIAGEQLLRRLRVNNSHREVQAQAFFHLAEMLKKQRNLMPDVKSQTIAKRRIEQFYGKDFTKHLASLDDLKVGKEIETLYEQIAKSFADIELKDGTMGDVAKRELFAIRHLALGTVAPEIDGEDIDGRRMKLSGFRGRVVMLDFWGNW